MKRSIPLILPLILAIPLLVGVAGDGDEDAAESCQVTCAESEQACYDDCRDVAYPEACEDACYAAADACFDRCGG